MFKRKRMNGAAVASAQADLGQGRCAAVREGHSHGRAIYFQNHSFLHTSDVRKSTFLPTKTSGHVANQAQWKNVA